MGFFDSEPITMQGTIDEESRAKLEKLFELDKDLEQKLIEVFNIMTKKQMSKITMGISDGPVIRVEIFNVYESGQEA